MLGLWGSSAGCVRIEYPQRFHHIRATRTSGVEAPCYRTEEAVDHSDLCDRKQVCRLHLDRCSEANSSATLLAHVSLASYDFHSCSRLEHSMAVVCFPRIRRLFVNEV